MIFLDFNIFFFFFTSNKQFLSHQKNSPMSLQISFFLCKRINAHWYKISKYIFFGSLNSSTPRNMEHFGNRKSEKLLKSPILYGKNEFPFEMCICQLITEILSFFYFNKNFMPNVSSQIAKKLSMTEHF